MEHERAVNRSVNPRRVRHGAPATLYTTRKILFPGVSAEHVPKRPLVSPGTIIVSSVLLTKIPDKHPIGIRGGQSPCVVCKLSLVPPHFGCVWKWQHCSTDGVAHELAARARR
jgi:hypothetical protein